MNEPKFFFIALTLCTLAACGGGGGGGGNDTPPPPADTSPPTLILPADISVEETSADGAIVQFQVSATDNVDPSPSVSCSPASGSLFPRGTTTVNCTATDSSNNQSHGSFTVTVTPKCGESTGGTLTIEGTFTFDRVPHYANEPGLNYANTVEAPARHVTVNALDSENAVIASTRTGESGRYSLQVPDHTLVTIQILAEMRQADSPPYWEFHIRDNTNNNGLYGGHGGAICTGSTDQVRNYHAPSGWGESSYTGTRTAAPFAILDVIHDAVQLITDVDPALEFPPLEIYWSTNNTTYEIGGSHYDPDYSKAIYLMGDENVNTDEYDTHVIAHELFHYVEDRLSRSDSLGGTHHIGDYLDMRLAFGEGLASAYSAMTMDDPLFRDSNGQQQSQGFSIDFENDIQSNAGWYNEISIGKILYDLFDSNNDVNDNDNITLGFSPVWEVLVNEQRDQVAFTSIFKFIFALKERNPTDISAIDDLTGSQDIHVFSPYGDLETNDAGLGNGLILPIFYSLSTNSPLTVCVTNHFICQTLKHNENALGVRRYVTFTPPVAGIYNFIVQGSGMADPYVIAHEDAEEATFDLSTGNSEYFHGFVYQREYLFEIIDHHTLSNAEPNSFQCFDIRVEFIE